MKLKIIKKNIKEGVSAAGREYSIKSLLVVFSEAEVYEKIVAHLRAQGTPEASINKFCSPREYKGETSYSFFLSCSNCAVAHPEMIEAATIRMQRRNIPNKSRFRS